MGETKSLTGSEAATKIVEIVKGEVAMLCTFSETSLRTRPMGTPGIDPDGTLWFMSRVDSAKIREIEANARVEIVYAIPSKSEYVHLAGSATVSHDQAKIDELWNPLMKAWFSDGKDDPAIRLIKVVPDGGHYWDTKTNKMIQMVKIAIGAVMGKPFDDGIEGDLKV